jgi:hypothetical protein
LYVYTLIKQGFNQRDRICEADTRRNRWKVVTSACYAATSGVSDGKAPFKRYPADTSEKMLVAGTRAVHLPSTPSARFAHPNTT